MQLLLQKQRITMMKQQISIKKASTPKMMTIKVSVCADEFGIVISSATIIDGLSEGSTVGPAEGLYVGAVM